MKYVACHGWLALTQAYLGRRQRLRTGAGPEFVVVGDAIPRRWADEGGRGA
jgi:hypothetical protein